MDDFKSLEVAEKSSSYPKTTPKKLMSLRPLILDTASDIKDLHELEETLKWGEPSYIAKHF